MIEGQPIDYEVEYNKVNDELAELIQKYSELEQDWEYIKSLLDAEFKKNVQLKKRLEIYKLDGLETIGQLILARENIEKLQKKNKQLKSENKRLTDKLNKTALELVDGVISQGKATEISEMSYREFLDYRAKNGKPMELQL